MHFVKHNLSLDWAALSSATESKLFLAEVSCINTT